jgi:hypothetical protein
MLPTAVYSCFAIMPPVALHFLTAYISPEKIFFPRLAYSAAGKIRPFKGAKK